MNSEMTELFKNTCMLKKHLTTLLLIFSLTGFSQEKTDRVVSKQSLFVIPHASYQQETSLAPGIAYGYYFKSHNISRISSFSGSAVYTFRNQFTFNATPKIFFPHSKWYLYSNLNFRSYPDVFFGIGNSANNITQKYTSQLFSILLQPQYNITKNLLLGFSLSARHEKTITDTSFEANKEVIFQQFGIDGWSPYTQFNGGIIAAIDTRDNQFYPQKGIFAKSSFSTSRIGWGSSYSLQEISFDVRHFIALLNSHIFAWQFYVNGMYGENGIPFQLLPTVGGRDILRGYRQGMYRDNLLVLTQAEYRLPIYKRLKAAVFCSLGDVISSSDYRIYKLKVSYGAGLRYRLNDARVHLRLDFAKNNYGDKLQFYITATEAF